MNSSIPLEDVNSLSSITKAIQMLPECENMPLAWLFGAWKGRNSMILSLHILINWYTAACPRIFIISKRKNAFQWNFFSHSLQVLFDEPRLSQGGSVPPTKHFVFKAANGPIFSMCQISFIDIRAINRIKMKLGIKVLALTFIIIGILMRYPTAIIIPSKQNAITHDRNSSGKSTPHNVRFWFSLISNFRFYHISRLNVLPFHRMVVSLFSILFVTICLVVCEYNILGHIVPIRSTANY